MRPITALVAEDESGLREELCEALQRLWPALQLVARVADGADALAHWERLQPDVAFLDIQMPRVNGLDVARVVSARSHVVFVTAYDNHAVQAFEHGAVDYVLKPFDMDRLAMTVERLKHRVTGAPAQLDDLLRRLRVHLPTPVAHLRWVTASLGQELRVITTEDICFFRAENKCTVVATEDKDSIITTPIKELASLLDPDSFWQVHRGTIVNIRKIARVHRDGAGQLFVQIRRRGEALPVSARYAHQFRQM
ncbi:MAG: LytTR family DNA-binding domain-containing protein [Steroidobacteraceae bacterium]